MRSDDIGCDDPGALFQEAAAHHQSGRLGEALARYDLVIARRPDAAAAHNNRGVVLADLERFEEALAAYDRALALEPRYADAHNNRGNALKGLGRQDEALASFDQAIALQPSHVGAQINRGNALKDQGRMELALASYDRVVALAPAYADAHNNRGNALKDLKRFDEALSAYDQALALQPAYADAHNNRGNLLKSLERPDEALAAYDRALALRPDHIGALINRGEVLRDLKRFGEALACHERLLTLRPDSDYIRGRSLHLRLKLCDWADFERLSAEVEAMALAGGAAAQPFDMLALSASPETQRCAAERLASQLPPSVSPLGPYPTFPPHERIRIGYFSADFHSHATMHLVAEMLERHDRSRFDLIAFSFGPDRSDRWRERAVAAFDQFIDVRLQSDREIATLARGLEIDIAVDLKGYTAGGRPGIFAERAAAVQVSYLGYPGAMGAPFMDYMIADRIVVPAPERAFYSEKIAFLPDSYLAARRAGEVSASAMSRADAGLPEGAMVYCCFNNNHKLTPSVFDIWMRVLGRVEGSVLWLWVDGPEARNNLRGEAERRGVDAGRLVFAGAMPIEAHLSRLRLADLFLDTLPYNAHTTACDALQMGLPLLTCMGRSFASRVAASLLTAAGLPELITATPAAYEASATALGLQPRRLNQIKRKLAAGLADCALFDSRRHVRHIESAYLSMYARARAHMPPDDIHVQSVGITAPVH